MLTLALPLWPSAHQFNHTRTHNDLSGMAWPLKSATHLLSDLSFVLTGADWSFHSISSLDLHQRLPSRLRLRAVSTRLCHICNGCRDHHRFGHAFSFNSVSSSFHLIRCFSSGLKSKANQECVKKKRNKSWNRCVLITWTLYIQTEKSNQTDGKPKAVISRFTIGQKVCVFHIFYKANTCFPLQFVVTRRGDARVSSMRNVRWYSRGTKRHRADNLRPSVTQRSHQSKISILQNIWRRYMVCREQNVCCIHKALRNKSVNYSHIGFFSLFL